LDGIEPIDLLGENDARIKKIREKFPELDIITRGNTIRVSGEKKQTQDFKSKIEALINVLKEQKILTPHAIEDVLQGTHIPAPDLTDERSSNIILYNKDSQPIRARTVNQKRLVKASENSDIVFAIGPAGTGKTYTAVALAVRALKNRLVKKIILTRPAVEAGESLGFLPGDLKEKIDPYLRPLYDALDDMIPADKLALFMNNRTIEVAPLAYMRGRTLDNAFIILDEAQNTTTPQLKMFLTRLGPSGKVIVTGDLTQIDLPYSQQSGLKRALHLLDDVEGIDIVHLNESDVVRHRLVREIIKKYETDDAVLREQKEREKAEKEEKRKSREDKETE